MSDRRTDAPLRVLFVEDSDDDARLEALELERSGLSISAARVDTAEGLLRELSAKAWDVILADYTLPTFSGIEALKLAQRYRPDVPFIIVSGTITEEAAVLAMKAGAQDYVIKNNLARLAPAVRREVAEGKLRAAHARAGRELIGLKARAAEDLERSRHQLEIILRGVAEAIVAQDESGRVVYANDAAARALSCPSPADLIGAQPDAVFRRFELWDEAGHPIDPRDMPGLDGDGGHTSERTVRLRHRHNGEERWYIVVATWMAGTTTSAPLVITIFRDVTDRRRAEVTAQYLACTSATLAGSLDLRATLDTITRLALPRLGEWCAVDLGADASHRARAPVAMAHADPAHTDPMRTLWTEHALQVSRRVMSTGTAERFAIPVAPGALADGAASASVVMVVPLATHERAFGTLTFGRRDHERAYGLDELALAEEVARRAAFALESAQLYKESQDAIRARDEFLAVASHELRTPLTALMLQLHVAQRYTGSPELPTRLEAAVRHTKRLANLVDNLLDASRITTGRMKVQVEELDLRDAARDVVDRFQEEARRARCEVRVHAPAPVIGAWDRLRVEQVFTNLLSNALKYGAGSPVDISIERAGATARISVTDHGIGIAPEDVARIFAKFERAVSVRHYGGLGLGLFIARQIVEAHGGTIQVKSAPGAGSTFTVEMPLRPALSVDRVETARAS